MKSASAPAPRTHFGSVSGLCFGYSRLRSASLLADKLSTSFEESNMAVKLRAMFSTTHWVMKPYDHCMFNSVKTWLIESPLNNRGNLLDECPSTRPVRQFLNPRPGGGVNTPCGISRIAKKRRSAAVFYIPYQQSISHFFENFVPRSSQARSPAQVKRPYLPKNL